MTMTNEFFQQSDDPMMEKIKESIMDAVVEELRSELRTELKEELLRELTDEESGDERSEDDYPWIVFVLDGTEYGVNSKHVLSIETIGEVTPIIDANRHCPGITRSRGNMIELLDLRALFGMGDYYTAKDGKDEDDPNMMVVIETNGVKRGLTVDQIVSVEFITEFLTGGLEDGGKHISRIAKRDKMENPVLLLNIESLTDTPGNRELM